MYRAIIIIVIMLLIPSFASADKVYLKGGEVVEGEIIERSEALLKIKQANGIIRQLFKFQYDSVVEDLPDPDDQYKVEPLNLEELTPVENISSDKQELIKELIYLTGMRANIDKMINKTIDQSPLEKRSKMREIFNTEDMIDELKPIYDKYYTLEDLQKLVTLYNSELGQKMLEVTPKISREAMQAVIIIFQNKISP